jgi:hypothetical protein
MAGRKVRPLHNLFRDFFRLSGAHDPAARGRGIPAGRPAFFQGPAAFEKRRPNPGQPCLSFLRSTMLLSAAMPLCAPVFSSHLGPCP